jgi:transposase-like protein
MSSGKRRCSECKYDFILHKLPMRLARAEWKRIIRFFLMEQSSNSIIERTQFERRHVFRALTKIRIVLAKDVP